MACGQQKVKGGNGSNIASSSASCSASCSASSIPLNLGVGCAPSCWPIFGSETSWVLPGGAEGSFLCSLITDFLAEGAGWGASPGPGGELGCVHRFAARAPCDSKGSQCQCGIHTAEAASAL